MTILKKVKKKFPCPLCNALNYVDATYCSDCGASFFESYQNGDNE